MKLEEELDYWEHWLNFHSPDKKYDEFDRGMAFIIGRLQGRFFLKKPRNKKQHI